MFITFEGGEGTGKTTLIQNIAQRLRENYEVVTTREPGGSLITEAIRDVILNPKYQGVTPYTEALLLAASRAQHLDEVILPALKNNKIVLCDRYLDSSLAYQAYARHLGFDFVLSINRYAVEHLPKMTFYIDLDPQIGLSRIKHRSKYDRLDQEAFDFHTKVREGYLEVLKRYPERMIKIDGEAPIEVIEDQIMQEILKRL
ncbi:MAG: dTMP kinase [Acholeplasmataceae bacterium]|jgi:dTMP kinase|nr:dTMP kinase [Acholeplasmataceae bacterium]